MASEIPEGRIVTIDRVSVRLDPSPHRFEIEHAAAIEANWQREFAANPALFDGRMMMHSELGLAGRTLVGRAHAVRFATLLYWRRHRPAGARHAFAHAALVASDGALVAVRMGPHTAAAGRVYFAAGSFEASDFPGGMVDVDLNMRREVLEETGLDLAGARPDDGYQLWSGENGVVVFRRYRLGRPAAELATAIEAFVAGEAEPEITGPVVLTGPADRPRGLSAHMIPFMQWHFENVRAGSPPPGGAY